MPTRRIVLAGVFAAASSCLFRSIQTHAEVGTVSLVGRQVQWTGILPGVGWVGGNVDQIKESLALLRANPRAPVKVIEDMIPIAEQCDAYVTNFADGLTRSGTITTLQTKAASIHSGTKDFSNASYRSALANALAKPPISGASGSRIGAQTQTGTQIVFVKQATTGAKPALGIAIRADMADNTAFYVIYQLVILQAHRWHFFNLTVDADHYKERLNDFNQMLATVRYES